MFAIAASIATILILTILLVLLIIYAIYETPRKRTGYIPLPPHGVAAVVKALALPVNASATLVDLGCGDGRVLEAALRQHPQAEGLGVEINPLVALLARWRLRNLSDRARIIRGDLFKTDVRQA